MKEPPATPPRGAADGLTGHIWVQELPTGGTFRFQVAPSGFVTFATPAESFDAAAAVPAPFRLAAHQIDTQLDRDAFQAATDTPEAITFCGIATRNEGIEYDWETLPPFVGTDVWSGETETWLSPDAATGVFERLSLPTLAAIEKESPAAHTDLTRFEDPASAPESAWRDGPVAAVLIRDKSGGRASVPCLEPSVPSSTDANQTASDLAASYATTARIQETITAMRGGDCSLSVDVIRDRLVATLAREAYADLFPNGECSTSLAAFESAVAQRVQRYQSTEEW